MITKKSLKQIICLTLALTLCIGIISGCARKMEMDVIGPSDEVKFDLLMDELFEDWITTDALTMNYFLADPYVFDIERPETTFGEVVSQETIDRSKEETRELKEKLSEYNYSSLRHDQQIVYDILSRIIKLSEVLERNDNFSYYTGYIRPLTGFQVQMPVLLAEFNFYTAEDIDRYLELIGDTRRYYDDIIEFERERSRRGYFLSEANVDSVIEQIESYLEDREDNLLITVFNDRIDNYPGLTADQRETYKQRNKDLVLGNVLVAYENLLKALQELRGVGARPGGLASLPGGQDYAHALLKLRVGTDRSIEELEGLLEDWFNKTLMEIMEALHGGPQLLDKYLDDELGQLPEETPEAYIASLQQHIARVFPPIAPTGLTVLEVHESLQEHTSPAFYLAPAVDRFDENVVYVNPASIDDNLFMFTVLAHESYPGHMYQTVYFLQQSPHPIRVSISNTGYSEGWATYAEMMSYGFVIPDETEAQLLWNFRFFDMLLQSYVDLGVNVLGWSMEDVAETFMMIGIMDMEVVESVYNTVTGIPLNSLTYSLGLIELTMLKEDAQRVMGDSFDLMDFHRFFLDFGSAPYPIIRSYLDARLRENIPNALAPAA